MDSATLNYLGVSGCKLSLIVNFGEVKLNYSALSNRHESNPEYWGLNSRIRGILLITAKFG